MEKSQSMKKPTTPIFTRILVRTLLKLSMSIFVIGENTNDIYDVPVLALPEKDF